MTVKRTALQSVSGIDPEVGRAPERGAKVLVAAAVRDALSEPLRDLGCSVRTVGDGDAAWRTLQQERMRIAILDVVMPGIDGLSLCRRLRAKNSEAVSRRPEPSGRA